MSEKRLIWFKGEIISANSAKVSVLSPTSQFGANVFEGIRCYWDDNAGNLFAFKLDEHLRRLLDSVKLIRFENKYDFDYLKQQFIETVKANNYQDDTAVRQTIFLDGSGSWFSTGPTDMFIAPIKKGRFLEPGKTGLAVCISSWERIKDNSFSPRIKVGANYINSRSGQLEAQRNKYDTTIFLNSQGKVSEAPGSCVFIIRDQKLITPPVTASILESITRKTIIQIASDELGIEVVERDVDRTELYLSDGIFLCGTAIELVPVINIDGLSVETGDSKIYSDLYDLYFKIVRNKISKYSKWLTQIY